MKFSQLQQGSTFSFNNYVYTKEADIFEGGTLTGGVAREVGRIDEDGTIVIYTNQRETESFNPEASVRSVR